MATTRIMPLHVGKGRTESRAISDIIDYVANPSAPERLPRKKLTGWVWNLPSDSPRVIMPLWSVLT